MSACGIDSELLDTVKVLAKEHGATVQEVVSTLLRMQLNSLSEDDLQAVSFRRGRKQRSVSAKKVAVSAVAVSDETVEAYQVPEEPSFDEDMAES